MYVPFSNDKHQFVRDSSLCTLEMRDNVRDKFFCQFFSDFFLDWILSRITNRSSFNWMHVSRNILIKTWLQLQLWSSQNTQTCTYRIYSNWRTLLFFDLINILNPGNDAWNKSFELIKMVKIFLLFMKNMLNINLDKILF